MELTQNNLQARHTDHIGCIGNHGRKVFQSATDCRWNSRNGTRQCVEFIYRTKHTTTAEFMLLPQLLPKVSSAPFALKIVSNHTNSNFIFKLKGIKLWHINLNKWRMSEKPLGTD